MEHILWAAALCILVYILFLLAHKNLTRQVRLLAAAYSTLAWLLLYYAASVSGWLRFFPLLYHTDVVASAFAAPSIYLYFISVIDEGKKPVRSWLAFYVAPALFLTGIIVSNAITPPLAGWTPGLPDEFSSPAIFALNCIPDTGFAVYFTLALFHGWRALKRGAVQHRREHRVLMLFLATMFAVSVFMLFAYPFRSTQIFVISLILFAFIVTAFFLAIARIPEYLLGAQSRAPEKNAAAAPLLSADEIQTVRDRLDRMLEAGDFFRDPDVSLRALAKRIGITSNQLSFFMNSVLGKTFPEYINGLRLESVERDLREKKDSSILEIAMDNGFASKSPFNALFQKKYGMTPSEWRRKNLQTEN